MAIAKQLDGALDSSEEDESEESDDNMDNDDDDDLDKDDDDDAEHEDAAEEEPLNSEDDVTDEDSAEVFDTDNVIVCQYDKVSSGGVFPCASSIVNLLPLILTDNTLTQQMEILSQGWHYEYARQGLCVSKIKRRCWMVIQSMKLWNCIIYWYTTHERKKKEQKTNEMPHSAPSTRY